MSTALAEQRRPGGRSTARILLSGQAWAAHVLVVVAVVAAILLGLWQLDAWQSAREREARDVSDAAPVALLDAIGVDDPFPGQYLGHPVTLTGRWLTDSTLYVSDRARDGEVGYWVMTPVLVDGTDSAMPVVRGWSPRAEAPPAQGEVEVSGWLQPSEGSSLPSDSTREDVIPEMRVASVTQHVDGDLFSGFVVTRQASDGTTGLGSVTPDQIPSISPVTSLKNLLYAIQWWVFGGFAVYIWQRWLRDQVALEHAVAEEPLDDGAVAAVPVSSGP